MTLLHSLCGRAGPRVGDGSGVTQQSYKYFIPISDILKLESATERCLMGRNIGKVSQHSRYDGEYNVPIRRISSA